MVDTIAKKDEMIISLLGRLVFPEEKLKNIIAKNKRNPNAYLRGYNSCDGKRIVSEIAKVIGVNQSTLTPIINDWEIQGIIYEVESNRGKTYKCLYKLSGVKDKIDAPATAGNNSTSTETANSQQNTGDIKNE